MLSKVVFLDKKVLSKFSTSSLQVLDKFSTSSRQVLDKFSTSERTLLGTKLVPKSRIFALGSPVVNFKQNLCFFINLENFSRKVVFWVFFEA